MVILLRRIFGESTMMDHKFALIGFVLISLVSFLRAEEGQGEGDEKGVR